MDGTEAFLEDEQLIKRNLKKFNKVQQINSDESLLHRSDTSSLSKHNEQYTTLLKAYVKDFKHNSKNKRKNKESLFKIAKMLLIFVPLCTLGIIFLSIIFLVLGKIEVLEVIPGLITAIVSLIGTFMVIPQMITDYLFNKEEEDHLANIISKIQEYDRDIRGGI